MEPKSTHKPPKAATMVAAAAAGRLRDGMIEREVEDDLWMMGWMHVMEALSVLRHDDSIGATGRPARTQIEAAFVGYSGLDMPLSEEDTRRPVFSLPTQAGEEASGRSKECRSPQHRNWDAACRHGHRCSRTEPGELRHRSMDHDHGSVRYIHAEKWFAFALSDLTHCMLMLIASMGIDQIETRKY